MSIYGLAIGLIAGAAGGTVVVHELLQPALDALTIAIRTLGGV